MRARAMNRVLSEGSVEKSKRFEATLPMEQMAVGKEKAFVRHGRHGAVIGDMDTVTYGHLARSQDGNCFLPSSPRGFSCTETSGHQR